MSYMKNIYNDDVAKRHMPDLFTIISTSPINNY